MLMTNTANPIAFDDVAMRGLCEMKLLFFRRIRHVHLLIFDFKFRAIKTLVFEFPNSGQTSNASFSENWHSTQNLGVFLITISFT